ncbi:hypothetical protein GCM10011519_32300 [Marmoricola endophyticus]|uniref:MmcQ/YjbR family DNA-binding protein n=1 Tax=Marmoricola endophyticus TaxID=2040280 RepID=A0A917BTM6_9ACTN|nr:MmcQ/YjbR family DNA-binding protein [Marmoricola endophyticus]GGF55905.1 hypothetical protein GCM10011519_32300 [Marmoricola endophyticus]
MAHPQMYDDSDPLLARVRAIALALPDAAEKVGHGRPTFFTTKVFCYFGGSQKPPAGGEHVHHDAAVLVLPDAGERPALLEDERFFHPAYLGPAGWVGFDLPALDAPADAWAEVAELVDASYRNTAGVRRVKRLDAS